MRLIIVGAGAVGGGLGSLLARADQPVILVARGQHGRTIRERGLTLRTADFQERLLLECVSSVREVSLRDGDIVILAVKSQDVEAALDGIDAGIPVACTQNGVVAEVIAARRFEYVCGIMSWIPAVYLQPGAVDVHAVAPWAVFRVGTFRGDPGPGSAITGAMTAAGLDARLVDDIMAYKRGKLLNNLGNVLDAYFVRDPGLGQVARMAAAEGAAVLDAAGLAYIDPTELFRDMRARLDHGAAIEGQTRAGGSTWQSLIRGVASEIEYLNGWICELGARVGVATPVSSMLISLARRATGPRSIPISALDTLLRDARSAP